MKSSAFAVFSTSTASTPRTALHSQAVRGRSSMTGHHRDHNCPGKPPRFTAGLELSIAAAALILLLLLANRARPIRDYLRGG
jgi:hypothetical protein